MLIKDMSYYATFHTLKFYILNIETKIIWDSPDKVYLASVPNYIAWISSLFNA